MKGPFLLSSQRLEHGNDLYNVSDVFGQKDRGKEKKTKKKKKKAQRESLTLLAVI